jgi:uncharacterized coiled-coil DUF342 family protein
MTQTSPSPFMQAAEALDHELQRLEQLAESLEKLKLQSRKALEKAAQGLQEVADVDDRLNLRVKELSDALGQARARQNDNIARIQQVAKNLQDRTEVFRALMEKYAALGINAAELNSEMQKFAAERESKPPEDVLAEFGALKKRMSQAISASEAIAESAQAESFDELNRQADSLRQQMMSVLNKMNLMLKAQTGSTEPLH